MSELKSKLENISNELKGLEERARKLKNQNLADIIASAHGKVRQFSEHPDLELVADRKDQAHEGNPLYVAPKTKEEAVAKMRTDGDADPEGTARMNWPHLFDVAPALNRAGPPSYPELAKESAAAQPYPRQPGDPRQQF